MLKRENCHDSEVKLGYRGGVGGGTATKEKKTNKILETNAFHHVIFI